MQLRRQSYCALSVRFRATTIAIVYALIAGGCAATATPPARVAGPAVPVSGDPPALPAPPSQTAKSAVEADGFPVQLARRDRAAAADDPLEPWSPNYGVAQPDRRVRWQRPAKPDDAMAAEPATVSRVIPRRIDADDIIRQAIAAHEMRQNK